MTEKKGIIDTLFDIGNSALDSMESIAKDLHHPDKEYPDATDAEVVSATHDIHECRHCGKTWTEHTGVMCCQAVNIRGAQCTLYQGHAGDHRYHITKELKP